MSGFIFKTQLRQLFSLPRDFFINSVFDQLKKRNKKKQMPNFHFSRKNPGMGRGPIGGAVNGMVIPSFGLKASEASQALTLEIRSLEPPSWSAPSHATFVGKLCSLATFRISMCFYEVHFRHLKAVLDVKVATRISRL